MNDSIYLVDINRFLVCIYPTGIRSEASFRQFYYLITTIFPFTNLSKSKILLWAASPQSES